MKKRWRVEIKDFFTDWRLIATFSDRQDAIKEAHRYIGGDTRGIRIVDLIGGIEYIKGTP